MLARSHWSPPQFNLAQRVTRASKVADSDPLRTKASCTIAQHDRTGERLVRGLACPEQVASQQKTRAYRRRPDYANPITESRMVFNHPPVAAPRASQIAGHARLHALRSANKSA